MSVAIRKLEGVESVEVSLNEGTADVILKPGNQLDPERIRQVARDNGFTPKGSDVRVAGRVVERGGRPALAVTGLHSVYLLEGVSETKGRLDELTKAMGKEVVVSGHLPETAPQTATTAPRELQLRDFVLQKQ